MSRAAQGFRSLRIFLEMIKVEHSIFALPFAMVGMMWGSVATYGTPWPGAWTFGWIVVAMVACRSAAMAFNRIVDRDVDAANPRTRMRAIPAGLIRLRTAHLYLSFFIGLFIFAAAMLQPLALALSPLALFVTLGYSWTKRFTWLSHWVLGLSLGIAPAAAWIAVSGQLAPAILPLTLAVVFWTAGFDILYAMQDAEFDRERGLHSVPERFGARRALAISRIDHALAIAMMLWAAAIQESGPWVFLGVLVCGAVLVFEQAQVRENDLSKLNVAFFTMNGVLSMVFFGSVLLQNLL